MERREDDNRIVYVGDSNDDNDLGSYDNVSNCSYVLLPSAEKMVETDEAIETLRLAKQRHDSNLHINSVNSPNYVIDDNNSSTTSSCTRSSGSENSIDEISVNSDTSSGKNNFKTENFTKKDLLFIKLEERWNNRFVRSDKDCPVQPLPRKASAKKFQKKGKATHRKGTAYSNINNNKRNVYINNDDDDETFASRTLAFVPYNNEIHSHTSPSSFSGEHNLPYKERENNNNVLYDDVTYDSEDGSDDVQSEEEISVEQLEEWSEQWEEEEEEESVDNDSSIESSDAIARSVVNDDNNRPYLAFIDALETTSPSIESGTDTPMSNETRTNANRFVEVLTVNNAIIDENNYVGDMDDDDNAIMESKDDTNSAETKNYSKYVDENDTIYITLPSEFDSDTDVLDSNYNNVNVTDMQENNAFSPSSEIDDNDESMSEEQIINTQNEHTDFVNDADDINNITFLDGDIEQLVDNYDDDDDVESGENSKENQISTNRNSKRKVRFTRKRGSKHSVRKQDTQVGDSSIREMHAPYQHPSEGETLEQRLRRRERLFKEMKRLEHENKKLSVKENAG